MFALGVDIGGTNLVVGAVPAAGGAAEHVVREPTRPEEGPDQAVERIGAMADSVVERLRDAHGPSVELVGVGIGCPGPLDLATGVILTTPNLKWEGFPIRDRISERLDLPASLDNDANCATYAEFWLGAGKGVHSLVGLTLGTGIGGGIVLDGRLLRGASGAAGEIGHMTIDVTGRRCACGNYGCVEAYASGPNIAARAREGIEAGYESVLPELVDGDLSRLTAETVYEGLVLGDAYAHEVMTETAKILGAAVANLVTLFNPEMIVIVGGVTRAGDHLFGPLRTEVRIRAFEVAVDACRILPGALTETAGVVGAAGIFLNEGPGR